MKLAVCNELFGQIPLEEAAEIARGSGFSGLEFAPFTLFGDFSSTAIRRGTARAQRVLAQSGLAFAGLHWLLAKPDGLHITTPDGVLRKKSWEHVRRLMDAAAELGGGNLVLGSPKQRSPVGGQSVQAASDILAEELATIAPYAAERKSPLLLEALSSNQTAVINRLAEVEAIVARIGNPGVSGMFDFHNCADETSTHAELIARHIGMIRHVHLNDPQGNPPQPDDMSYLPAFAALRELAYDAWVSLEIFSTPKDPAAVLRQTAAYIGEIERRLAG